MKSHLVGLVYVYAAYASLQRRRDYHTLYTPKGRYCCFILSFQMIYVQVIVVCAAIMPEQRIRIWRMIMMTMKGKRE